MQSSALRIPWKWQFDRRNTSDSSSFCVTFNFSYALMMVSKNNTRNVLTVWITVNMLRFLLHGVGFNQEQRFFFRVLTNSEVMVVAVSTIELIPSYCITLTKQYTKGKSNLINFENKLGNFSKHYVNVSNQKKCLQHYYVVILQYAITRCSFKRPFSGQACRWHFS
jgi:hypothetical protein